MSSCISGGGAIEIIKPLSTSPAASSPLRSAQSSPSSALSEASNGNGGGGGGGGGGALAIKRMRAPRKRPNTAYNEAAALLAAIYPSVFPAKKSAGRAAAAQSPLAARRQFADAPEVLLPPLPMLGDDAGSFLLRGAGGAAAVAALPSPSYFKSCLSPSPVNSPCSSTSTVNAPASAAVFDDDCGGVGGADDFDAESILDEQSEGIDGIMGNLTVDAAAAAGDGKDVCLMVFGLACNVGIRNIRHALKRSDDGGAWWTSPAVPVADISVPPPAPVSKNDCKTSTSTATALPKKKSGKKKPSDKKETPAAAPPLADGAAQARKGLGLKLDAGKVLAEWSDRGSMFADGGPDSPPPTKEALAKLTDMDLLRDGGVRKASVMRYKEKRQTRLFSKKIRYQVRKLNADCRPRMKGRFVRSPSLLQQAMEEGS